MPHIHHSPPTHHTHLTGIQRSADATHPPVRPQGNSALAAIQRSADGPPPPVRPLNPHTSKKIPHSKHPPQQKILPSILQISLTKDTFYTSNINSPPKHHTDLSLPQPTHRTDCRRGGCMVVPGAVVSPAVRPSLPPHPQKKEPKKGPKTRSAPVVAYRGDYYEKNCMCNDTDTHHYSVFRNVLSNYPYTTRQI